MKKSIFAMAWIVSIAYVIWFSFCVSDFATKHVELEVSIPIFAMLFSLLCAVSLLILNLIKRMDKVYFYIPVLFFSSAAITFIIGYFTVCPVCAGI